MSKYIVFVIVLNFSVNLLLLFGTNQICGTVGNVFSLMLSALFGGIYAGLCLRPDLTLLGGFPYRLISLIVMALIAFGFTLSALRSTAVFLLLYFALSGLVAGLGMEGLSGVIPAAVGLLLLCFLGIFTRFSGQILIPVELTYQNMTRKVMALRDTGNTLTDPVTGKPVLVVGADIAEFFTGLSKDQLKAPVSNVDAFPGLRLVPYRTLDSSGGMLLMLRFTRVKIGKRKGSGLVAFASEPLHPNGKFQALCGGE